MKWDGTNYIYTRVDGTEYTMKDPFPSLTRKYWNLNTPWNLEQKITWDEIAPSLQELIVESHKIEWDDLGPNLQSRISVDENNIEANTEAITNEVSDRETAIENLQGQLNTLVSNVTALTTRISTVESTILSIQHTINNEIKSSITALSNRIDILDTDIEHIWGSELYRQNHSQYNIYQIWQHITDILQRLTALSNRIDILDTDIEHIWGSELYRQNHSQYNIYQIWQHITDILQRLTALEANTSSIGSSLTSYENRISDLEQRIIVLEGKVGTLEGKVEVLEEKTQFYIDQFLMDTQDSARVGLYIHFNNNFTIQTCYTITCDKNEGNRAFEDIVAAGYDSYDANNSNTYHYYVRDTVNMSKNNTSNPVVVLGTVNKLAHPFLNDQYICLTYTDEMSSNFYFDNEPGGTDTRSVVIARPYDNYRVLVSSVLIDKTDTFTYQGTTKTIPTPISNGVSFVAMGFANKI